MNHFDFDKQIRAITQESLTARPFICDGSPFDCTIAQVGINPGSDTPFWPFWDSKKFDKRRWMQEYRQRKAGKRTPTRNRIEVLNEALRPYRVIELNLYVEFSPREAQLKQQHRDTKLFDFMMDVIEPTLLFVHGREPRCHLERKLGVSLAPDDFTRTNYRGRGLTVFAAPRHLAFVSGGDDYVSSAGGRIKAYLGAQRA